MRASRYDRVKQPLASAIASHEPMFSQDRFPPAGTLCADCGCCRAGIYAGEGELRVAICAACDEGIICAPKQRMLDAAVAQASYESTALSAAANFEAAKLTLAAEPDWVDATSEPAFTIPEPHPAAPAAEPEPARQELPTMETRLCECGCGNPIPQGSNANRLRGHHSKRLGGAPKQPKTKRLPTPSTSLAKVEPVIEVDAPEEVEEQLVAINLSTSQLARIFFHLPIEEQGLAIQTALSADRS